MRFILITFICLKTLVSNAQELFVATEPASNMPANSLGIRLMNTFMKNSSTGKINYHFMPELMYGISKKWMVHVQGFNSTRGSKSLFLEGGSLYTKYRFYSADDLHKHFRLATYGRYSFNRADIHQEEIETVGHNSGIEIGMIATQLIHKTAISGSLSFEQALNNTSKYIYPITQSNNATNFTLSAGQLILPKKYKNYRQTNVNLMVELIVQYLNKEHKGFIDLVPSLQFIIHSKARIDIAYKRELYSHCVRTAPNGIWLKLEYNIFNAF